MTRPSEDVLAWVASVVKAPVAEVEGLRDGGSPWLLRLRGGGGSARAVVLRTGGPEQGVRERFETEAAALVAAAERGIAAPRLIAVGLDGEVAGTSAVLLSTLLPGRSRVPVRPTVERLWALGAGAAVLHAMSMAPRPGLPSRSRPLEDIDFAAMRRAHGSSRLFEDAERAVAQAAPSGEESVLVHGDLWQGNTLWNGDTLTGMVDWDAAGVGHYGVDLGSLRCDAAIYFGPRAAEEILTGWQRSCDRKAEDVAYWDVVAALSLPPDMADCLSALAGQGGPALDATTATARRDAFLRTALRQLER
jgi:aminoglycoside phosphotransferase (APT) family kinase protein